MRAVLLVVLLFVLALPTVTPAQTRSVTALTREPARRLTVPTLVRSMQSLGLFLTLFGLGVHVVRPPRAPAPPDDLHQRRQHAAARF